MQVGADLLGGFYSRELAVDQRVAELLVTGTVLAKKARQRHHENNQPDDTKGYSLTRHDSISGFLSDPCLHKGQRPLHHNRS